jgi:predicted transglutaminase-like cysteine proteinase
MFVRSIFALTVYAALGLGAPQHDPFSIETTTVENGPLVERWWSAQQQLRNDHEFLRACSRQPRGHCGAALELLRIVGEAEQWFGKTLVGHINRAINLAVRPASGGWQSGLDTLRLAEGNCTAYALAKYLALREAGISPDQLRLVIVRNERDQEDHMVVSVLVDGYWLVLDNATMALRKDVEATNYMPMFVLDENGVRRYGSEGPRASRIEAPPRPVT